MWERSDRKEERHWGVPPRPPDHLLPPGDGRPVDAARRTAILDWTVSQYVATGWRVESRSPTQAVLVRGQPVNHVLHAILTVFTCLLWGIVWIALVVGNRVERVALTVEDDGQLQVVQGPG
ncbi:hypothetical protein [Streptomyces sp. NRRL F-2580]|uniref:hypothetical protein n=1 Tax=Streptomyces sp. NRRL F-2580 TaxID=1463841 RepID=UPI00068C9B31|nr:hypothetical protein [Streptomyces sp. NRRL F-2580]